MKQGLPHYKFDQAFQFIQEFTGFFTPGIVTLFLFGLFWERMNAKAALAAAAASFILSCAFWMYWPALPFMDRVGLVFVLCGIIAVVVSLTTGKDEDMVWTDLKGMDFRTPASFNVGALSVSAILVALYAAWW